MSKVIVAVIIAAIVCIASVSAIEQGRVTIERRGPVISQSVIIDGYAVQMNCDGVTDINLNVGSHSIVDIGQQGGEVRVVVNVTPQSVQRVVLHGQIATVIGAKPQVTPSVTIVPTPAITPTPEPTKKPDPRPEHGKDHKKVK